MAINFFFPISKNASMLWLQSNRRRNIHRHIDNKQVSTNQDGLHAEKVHFIWPQSSSQKHFNNQ